MKRREFIALVGGAAASPLVARAQQPTLHIGPKAPDFYDGGKPLLTSVFGPSRHFAAK